MNVRGPKQSERRERLQYSASKFFLHAFYAGAKYLVSSFYTPVRNLSCRLRRIKGLTPILWHFNCLNSGMKTLILSALILSITLNSYAQQSCPLTNTKLSGLREAASKLAKTITLSPECKAYQDTVNAANAQLKDIAVKIADSDGKLADGDKPDQKDLAAKAVGQLDTISSLFKDQRCGQQLVGFLDYASVFVDVATSMVPFLALYGGSEAMPWVLGPAIGGAAAKALIMFFKNKSIDMRNADQSNSFLKNSCSFYNLNQIKESLDDLEMRQSPAIEIALNKSRAELAELISKAPTEPDSDIVQTLKTAEKDAARIKFLQDQMKVDAVEGCQYVNAYANKKDPGAMVDRVWANYEKTLAETEFRLELEKKFFIDELNPAVAAGNDAAKCSRWITKMIAMSDAGIALLKKSSVEDGAVKSFQTYKDQKIKLEDSIKLQEARMKFFDELTGTGFNIEYSEIIRSHEQVQDSIFSSYRWLITLKMKGLAEAWLRVKLEDSEMNQSDFKKRRKEVEDRISSVEKVMGARFSKTSVTEFSTNFMNKNNNREHPVVTKNVLTDVCNQYRRTWTSWYNGSIHAKAGKDYCVAFDRVINKMDYPEVQELCFGTTTKNGKKLVRSLRNQVSDFKALKPEADLVMKKMQELSCKESSDTTADLLATPII